MSTHPEQEQQELPEFSTGRSDRVERIRKKAINTYEFPVYPKLSMILLLSMIVLTVAITAVDVRNELLYASPFSLHHLLTNASVSALFLWSIYSLLLVPVCLLGMRCNARSYEKRKRLSGIIDQTDEERSRSRRAVRRLNASFRLELIIALAGLLVFALLYAAVRL